MGNESDINGNGGVQYVKIAEKEEEFDIMSLLAVGGILVGVIAGVSYFISNNNLKESYYTLDMGRGRILNNNIRNYAMSIQDLEDLPNFTRRRLHYTKSIHTKNV